jgi:hypothetical protein
MRAQERSDFDAIVIAGDLGGDAAEGLFSVSFARPAFRFAIPNIRSARGDIFFCGRSFCCVCGEDTSALLVERIDFISDPRTLTCGA